MLKIGFDGGYGYTKVIASNGKSLIIPSIVGSGFKRQYGDLFGYSPKLNEDNIHAVIDGNDYFIGELARLESRNCSYAFAQNRINHLNTRILIAAATAMVMDSENEEIAFVAGAPFADYFLQKKEYQRYLSNFHADVKLYNGRNIINRTVRFSIAQLFPQAAGAIFALDENYDFGNDGLIGCIDIGTKTVDLAVFSPERMQLVESMSGTIDAGAYTIHGYIEREVEKLTNTRLETVEVEKVLRNGAYIIKKGKRYDLKDVLENGKKELAKRIKDEVVKKWSHKLNDFNMVFLVGGGAELLRNDINDIYEGVIIPENPHLLNAEGFLYVAKNLADSFCLS